MGIMMDFGVPSANVLGNRTDVGELHRGIKCHCTNSSTQLQGRMRVGTHEDVGRNIREDITMPSLVHLLNKYSACCW
jgi:hypothetical protein